MLACIMSICGFAQNSNEQDLLKEANLGNSEAQYKMGKCLGDKKEYTQAFEWYSKAAAQGFAPAAYIIGYYYENGMGVEGEEKYMDENGTVQDDYRIEFVRDHLEWIAKAIEDGANCLGYHYWGVIDNWSWCNAFKNRYGFVRVCLDDGYKRKEKKSASWIREVARTNEFE